MPKDRATFSDLVEYCEREGHPGSYPMIIWIYLISLKGLTPARKGEPPMVQRSTEFFAEDIKNVLTKARAGLPPDCYDLLEGWALSL